MAKKNDVQDALFVGADGCMQTAGDLMHNSGDWETAAAYLSSAADLLRMYGELGRAEDHENQAEENTELAAVLTAGLARHAG